jgi:osmotically-inducible protein OsmY
MLAKKNSGTSLRVGGRLSSEFQEQCLPAPVIEDQRCGSPIIEGAMELRAAMKLVTNPSLRQFSSAVQFCFRDGCMVMAGVLPTYFLKQLAQEAVRSLEGIEAIDNRIYVESADDAGASTPIHSIGTRVLPR